MAQGKTQEPKTVRLDPEYLRSSLKEFFDPVRTDDPRSDFYTVYRRESGEFDRDYIAKYDGDLNTSLLFAGLLSAVVATFITNVQPQLEPDSNDMIAAYMRILIHTANNSLFLDANPSNATWTGPPPQIVTVQAILYASLATSFLAAFLAMLGKQWISEYARSSGRSAAEKSRDRQWKLDALEDWYFRFVVESLPVILQLALLLLGCGLSIYLWKVSLTVARVALAFTLLGVTLYILFTLLATFCLTCPYHTPLSILVRVSTKSNFKSLGASLVNAYSRSANNLKQIPVRFLAWLKTLLCVASAVQDDEDPQHANREPDNWFFGETPDPGVYKGDARCISWILGSATDDDVIFCTARFAADTILYPEAADVISPSILRDHFLVCLSDGQVIPDKLEHLSVIGLALASALSIQLCIDPEKENLRDLSRIIHDYTNWISKSEPTFLPGVAVLRVVTQTPEQVQGESFRDWKILSDMPDNLPTRHKLCLSRTMLQTIWRWRRVPDQITAFNLKAIGSFCRGLMTNCDHVTISLKINCFLAIAMSLGDQVGEIHTLFTPNNEDALLTAITLFHKRFQECIKNRDADELSLTSAISALVHLDPFGVLGKGEWGFLWITEILNSGHPGDERYRIANQVMRLLERYLHSKDPESLVVHPDWIPPLARFLSPLYEGFHTEDSLKSLRFIALRILSTRSALTAFHEFSSGPPTTGNVRNINLGRFLQEVGDPFQATPAPLLPDGQPVAGIPHDPWTIVAALIELSSSDLWRNHLQNPNFASCEKAASTEALKLKETLDAAARAWPEFLRTPQKVTTTTSHLRALQCPNTAQIITTWADAR